MASRPPLLRADRNDGISGRRAVAYVPQISELLKQGVSYDMVVSEEVTHSNEVTRHPIEDPERSFIYDHNREEPVEMNLSLIVSTDPLIAGIDPATDRQAQQNAGIERLLRFQDQLLAMRAAQSVGTTVTTDGVAQSAFFTVYTGIRAYHNMGIEGLTFRRSPESPNTLEVDIRLVEFRFAHPPRSEDQAYLLDANDGPRNQRNDVLVREPDRSIAEATRERLSPRIAAPTRQTRSIIRAAIQATPNGIKFDLGIDLSGVVTDEDVSLLMVDDFPSQRFTMRIGGDNHDFTVMYNQMADRWSLTAGLSVGDCPKFAGRFIQPGYDLFRGLGAEQMLVPLDRPGITTAGLSWYARLTKPLGDGVPATMLALGSVAAFGGLFRQRASYNC